MRQLGFSTCATVMVLIASCLAGCDASEEAPRDDLRALAAGNNAFAFDLYQALRDGEENLLYSPYSLSVAMAMVYAGARGETEQQMADTLHFELPQERLHPAFNALGLELDSRSHAATREASGENVEKSGFELNIANAVWGQAGYTFLPEYLDLLALNYGAGVRLVAFQADPLAAADAINQWVSEETEGRIRDILDRLGRDTILVLTNAIYFDAAWALPFDEADTRDEPFYLLDGNEEKVPLMHQRDDFLYTEGDGYQAIQLPYENRNIAMMILLPREGRFREIEERLTGDWVQSVVFGFSEHDVILTMPKFSFETPVLDLVQTLGAMGMPDAFSQSDADFSAVAQLQPGEVICISRVLHKAFIEVDEKGTEAVAAVVVIEELTIVEAIDAPTEPPPIIMKIDRPFIFLIRDIKTNTILFVGRVMNPASE
jgi:serpin B